MSKTLTPSNKKVSFDDDKARKYREKVRAVYEKAGLSEVEAQRVNEAKGLNDIIAAFIEEHRYTDKYRNEEMRSNYRYLSGYIKPKGLMQQVDDLHVMFPGLGPVNTDYQAKIENGEIALPEWAEGWFAIPNWIKNPKLFGTSYTQAVQTILDKIKDQFCRFSIYSECKGTDKYLRQSVRSLEFWKRISEAQGDPDILVVPAQFGFRHRGRSGCRALEVMTERTGEFGLGVFAVGIMLLTHPKRLKHVDDLRIDCPGDEFDDPDSAIRFDFYPFFLFDGFKVMFGVEWLSHARRDHGSVSAGFVS